MKILHQKIKRIGAGWVFMLTVLLAQQGMAQLNPMSAIYYQNQYLANPALAGIEEGLTVNLGYRRQWNAMPQAPSTEYLTGGYKFTDKVGLGLNLYNEEAGLLRRTKVMGTYAYHLPVAENRSLHLGLSLGVMQERLDASEMNGDLDDPTVARFNDRGIFVDGDFGVAYTQDKLNVQFALPNVRSFFENEDNPVDRAVFFAAASYLFRLKDHANPITLEPKVCYRGVKGHDNILDVGANMAFETQKLNLFGLYHSTKNITFGAGLDVLTTLTVTAMFTTEASRMKDYAGGTYEVGVRGRLVNNK